MQRFTFVLSNRKTLPRILETPIHLFPNMEKNMVMNPFHFVLLTTTIVCCIYKMVAPQHRNKQYLELILLLHGTLSICKKHPPGVKPSLLNKRGHRAPARPNTGRTNRGCRTTQICAKTIHFNQQNEVHLPKRPMEGWSLLLSYPAHHETLRGLHAQYSPNRKSLTKFSVSASLANFLRFIASGQPLTAFPVSVPSRSTRLSPKGSLALSASQRRGPLHGPRGSCLTKQFALIGELR